MVMNVNRPLPDTGRARQESIDMRRILAVLAALSLAVTPQVVAATAVPVADWPELQFVFDPVVEGTDVVHDFIVRNTGEADLEIQRVKTG